MSDEWRALAKVAPKGRAANGKRYKALRVWQPPMFGLLTGQWQDWCVLGEVPYVGPLRTMRLEWRYAWKDGRVVYSPMLYARLRRFYP